MRRLGCLVEFVACFAAGFIFLSIDGIRKIGTSPDALGRVVLGIAGCATLGGTAWWLKSRSGRSEQEYREHSARDIYMKVHVGKVEPFYLYLRPFAAAWSRMQNPKYTRNPLSEEFYYEPKEIDVEALLDQCFQRPLMVIGAAGDTVGAWRLHLDDARWRAAFQTLADAALGIIVAPYVSEGLRWELNELRERGLLAKTVFFQPPAVTPGAWESARLELAEKVNIHLPPFVKGSSLFRINANGSHSAIVPLKGTWKYPVVLKSVLPRLF